MRSPGVSPLSCPSELAPLVGSVTLGFSVSCLRVGLWRRSGSSSAPRRRDVSLSHGSSLAVARLCFFHNHSHSSHAIMALYHLCHDHGYSSAVSLSLCHGFSHAASSPSFLPHLAPLPDGSSPCCPNCAKCKFWWIRLKCYHGGNTLGRSRDWLKFSIHELTKDGSNPVRGGWCVRAGPGCGSGHHGAKLLA